VSSRWPARAGDGDEWPCHHRLRPPLAWSRCVAGLPARDEVEKALLARAGVDASSQILCFETGGMPWKGHLYHLRVVWSRTVLDWIG
jgi:hypothetical protein